MSDTNEKKIHHNFPFPNSFYFENHGWFPKNGAPPSTDIQRKNFAFVLWAFYGARSYEYVQEYAGKLISLGPHEFLYSCSLCESWTLLSKRESEARLKRAIQEGVLVKVKGSPNLKYSIYRWLSKEMGSYEQKKGTTESEEKLQKRDNQSKKGTTERTTAGTTESTVKKDEKGTTERTTERTTLYTRDDKSSKDEDTFNTFRPGGNVHKSPLSSLCSFFEDNHFSAAESLRLFVSSPTIENAILLTSFTYEQKIDFIGNFVFHTKEAVSEKAKYRWITKKLDESFCAILYYAIMLKRKMAKKQTIGTPEKYVEDAMKGSYFEGEIEKMKSRKNEYEQTKFNRRATA